MKRRKAYPTLQAYLEANPTVRQYTLAKKVGITQAHMSNIINGERTPSLPLALLIAREANIPVESLIGKLHAEGVA